MVGLALATPELRDPISLSLPNTAVKRCELVYAGSLLAEEDRVVIYDLFGDKLDQRHDFSLGH